MSTHQMAAGDGSLAEAMQCQSSHHPAPGAETWNATAGADDGEFVEQDLPGAVTGGESALEAIHTRLPSEVYQRMATCLRAELASIEARLARIDSAVESDRFYTGWKRILKAQHRRATQVLAYLDQRVRAG